MIITNGSALSSEVFPSVLSSISLGASEDLPRRARVGGPQSGTLRRTGLVAFTVLLCGGAAILAAMVVHPGSRASQTAATFEGEVFDMGRPLAFAEITVLGVGCTARTNTTGYFKMRCEGYSRLRHSPRAAVIVDGEARGTIPLLSTGPMVYVVNTDAGIAGRPGMTPIGPVLAPIPGFNVGMSQPVPWHSLTQSPVSIYLDGGAAERLASSVHQSDAHVCRGGVGILDELILDGRCSAAQARYRAMRAAGCTLHDADRSFGSGCPRP